MGNKSALVLGASGLVGQDLTKILIDSSEYKEVTLLVRKKLNINSEKIQQEIVDFNNLEKYHSLFDVDSVFCCLGTTIKIAKTKENFKKVDLEYPMASAQITKGAGKGRFFVISAFGSNEKSKIFYNSVKGTLERKLKDMNLDTLHIFRPSILMGDRKDFRLGERITLALCKILPFVFIGNLKKYKPTKTKDLALAMYKASLNVHQGNYVHEPEEINKLATEV
ncbi:NAD(P)H-binding protein [Clostridium estertheticum]|uniref:NAD(P)H-binding protein n=1 Tax=Clostridium estertheticum TaxID=238834 RepID=UPI0013E9975D|nr:NAD(P)H-binding protein [Clostridium estertheticum]MBZ9688559.1 NAD(P)H-binding protein [Clostridium estertheticum]